MSSYFFGGKVFKRYFYRNFSFVNSVHFSDEGNFVQKKIKPIYVNFSLLKNNKSKLIIFKNFVKRFNKITNKNFLLFKNKFLHNDIVTNFDIIGLFISRALENIMYRAITIKTVNRFNSKNRNKSKFIVKRHNFFKTFFPYKTIPFIFL